MPRRTRTTVPLFAGLALLLALGSMDRFGSWFGLSADASATTCLALSLAAGGLLAWHVGRRRLGAVAGALAGGAGLAGLAWVFTRSALDLPDVPPPAVLSVSPVTSIALLLVASALAILGGLGGIGSRQQTVPFLGLLAAAVGSASWLVGIEPSILGAAAGFEECVPLSIAQVSLGLATVSAAVSDAQGHKPVRWLPVLVGLGAVAASLLLWRTLVTRERGLIDRMTQVEAAQVRSDLDRGLHALTFDLTRMTRRWERHPATDRNEWVLEAGEMLGHHPGVVGIHLLDAEGRGWSLSADGMETDSDHLPPVGARETEGLAGLAGVYTDARHGTCLWATSKDTNSAHADSN